MTLTIRSFSETDPQRPRAVRIALAGSLDTSTSFDLEREVERFLQEKPRLLVFDLAGLRFISSSGIRVIAVAQRRMSALKGLCLVTNPQPQVDKVLEIIKALPGLSIFRDEAEMDAYLLEIQQKIIDGDLPGQE